MAPEVGEGVWKDINSARESFHRASRQIGAATRAELMDFVRAGLKRADRRDAALAWLELQMAPLQLPLLEDLVQLIADDDRWAYRCGAIIRSIVDADSLARVEAKVAEILALEPDDQAYLHLGSLLRGLNSPMLESVIENAKLSQDQNIVDAAATLEIDGPRWQL